MSDAKLWTRDFVTVSLINFFLVMVFYLLIVIIGLYAIQHYQASVSQAGLAVGVFILGALAGRLLIGQLIDRIGRRTTMLFGLALSIATILLYYVELGIGFLLLCRFLHGISLGIASTATGTIVAQMIPDSRKGEGIGYFSLSTTLASAIGPFIGLYLLHSGNFQTILLICSVLAIVGLLAGFTLRVPELKPGAGAPPVRGFSLTQLVEPHAVPIALVTLLLAVCYSGVLAFINAYAVELDLIDAASAFFIAYSVAILLSRPFTGRWLDQYGANRVMFPCFVLLCAGLVLLGSVQSGPQLLLSGALIGLGFGNMQSNTQAIAVKLAPPHRIGLATSTFFIALDVGIGFGPYLLGLAIPHIGYANLYLGLALLALLGAPVYWLLHGRHAIKPRL